MGSEQKRAILAVVISGIILFGWQYFFAPQTKVTNKVTTQTKEDPSNKNNISDKKENEVAENIRVNKELDKNNSDISIFKISNSNNTYEFNNYLTITNAIYNNSNSDFKTIFKEAHNNSLLINKNGRFEKIYFNVTESDSNRFEIQSNDGSLTGFVILDEKGFFNVSLNSSTPFSYKFELVEKEEELEGGKTKQFEVLSDDLDIFAVGDDDKGDKEVQWFGMDFNYHLFATVSEKKAMVYKVSEDGLFSIKDLKATNQLSYKQIFVKKEYDNLSTLGNNLHLSVDFGIWSILAVPILHGLQFFYTILPNYGIAIILLTIIMRMLTFPLQYKSFKSMKKMQDIQPELTKIREKYKSDPQKMQQETMALFKKAGANPLGGCLPLLLQMPIFFAFYRVLYSSVELVDAPFYFWIVDLSQKDPYYVLPVLMAGAMFFHQKLTPTTTMDPTQRKLMMFMPLIFAVFMKDFPAGLTLYIFVSTVFALLQQMFVFKRTS